MARTKNRINSVREPKRKRAKLRKKSPLLKALLQDVYRTYEGFKKNAKA